MSTARRDQYHLSLWFDAAHIRDFTWYIFWTPQYILCWTLFHWHLRNHCHCDADFFIGLNNVHVNLNEYFFIGCGVTLRKIPKACGDLWHLSFLYFATTCPINPVVNQNCTTDLQRAWKFKSSSLLADGFLSRHHIHTYSHFGYLSDALVFL